jgi:hypothetical protein
MHDLPTDLKRHWAALTPGARSSLLELLAAALAGHLSEDKLLAAFVHALLSLPLQDQGSAWQFMHGWLHSTAYSDRSSLPLLASKELNL